MRMFLSGLVRVPCRCLRRAQVPNGAVFSCGRPQLTRNVSDGESDFQGFGAMVTLPVKRLPAATRTRVVRRKVSVVVARHVLTS